MVGDIKVFQQGRITYIILPHKVVVKTPHQAFFLDTTANYWWRRLQTIKLMIELGEIRTLNELAEWCTPGIRWVNTQEHFEVENDRALV